MGIKIGMCMLNRGALFASPIAVSSVLYPRQMHNVPREGGRRRERRVDGNGTPLHMQIRLRPE